VLCKDVPCKDVLCKDVLCKDVLCKDVLCKDLQIEIEWVVGSRNRDISTIMVRICENIRHIGAWRYS